MPVHEIQHRVALDGTPVVEGLLHLTPEQAGGGADAVRAVIAARYRVPTLSVDEILTLRELTALADGLDAVRTSPGVTIVVLSIARIGLLRDAVAEAAPGPATALLDELGDLHAEALRAALGAQPLVA